MLISSLFPSLHRDDMALNVPELGKSALLVWLPKAPGWPLSDAGCWARWIFLGLIQKGSSSHILNIIVYRKRKKSQARVVAAATMCSCAPINFS